MTEHGASFRPWASVHETHSGAVFFMGDRAFKIKKPVDLGFLDFTTRDARQRMCHAEVSLNRRLAPDVYLGVADVLAPDGAPCDHLVVMRRLPSERRLASLAAAGEPLDAEIRAIARVLAVFHERADRSAAIDQAASCDAVASRWEANATGMRPFAGRILDGARIETLRDGANDYLAGRSSLFSARIAAGRACDGHGDLLADDIFCLDDGPRILDCLEFDERLRFGDALEDVAFLAMDLERLGRTDLSSRFLADYREFAGDNWPASLAHLYVAYRAAVRAKVACVRADQGDRSAVPTSRELLDLATAHLARGAVRLVLVGGLPGTGKSTLAAGLGEVAGATVIRSDEVRKELAGVRPGERAVAAVGEGIYRPEVTAATYEEVLRRASAALRNGESVILDASWTSPHQRRAADAAAAASHARLIQIRCVAPASTAAARIQARLEHGVDASDATPEIAAALAAGAPPWPDATEIDTTLLPAEVLARARPVAGWV